MTRRALPAFPKEGLQFLRSLKRNNNREWFSQHKGIYEESVKAPIENLIATLAEDFRKFAPDIVASPKVSAYRIYRDTRFSKDKSPYKTHVAAIFPHGSLGRHEGAGFYLHIAPTELFIGGGLYMPLPEDLSAVRQRIAQDAKSFLKLIGTRQFRRFFGNVEGERLSRVPRGFPSDHPAADFLKCKQFLVGRTFPATAATEGSFYSVVLETFRAMYPFISYLNGPILEARRVRDRQHALLRM
jgi:uncharacterized protein (TIGR02453 family)